MIDVIVRTTTGDATKLTETAGHLQTRFKFRNCGFTDIHNGVNPGALLTLTDVPIAALFALDLDKGVTVSTFRSAGISRYLGWDVETYLLTCSLLGLLQWRVLALNTLLRPEDFLQHDSEYCLYPTFPICTRSRPSRPSRAGFKLS